MTNEKQLKLWKLEQYVNRDWDTYDSCIVAAYTEEEAKVITPIATNMLMYWALPSDVSTTLVGVADSSIDEGEVLCSSFNAG